MPSIFSGNYKARKQYTCDSCGGIIKKGQSYWRGFGSSDDAFKNPPPFVMRECSSCQSQQHAPANIQQQDQADSAHRLDNDEFE